MNIKENFHNIGNILESSKFYLKNVYLELESKQ